MVPTRTGPHALSITIEHNHVAGSPFTVFVRGGVAVGSTSRARAPFLLEAGAPPGQQVEALPAPEPSPYPTLALTLTHTLTLSLALALALAPTLALPLAGRGAAGGWRGHDHARRS